MDIPLKRCDCGAICGLEIDICPVCESLIFQFLTKEQLLALPGSTITGYFKRSPTWPSLEDWREKSSKGVFEKV